MFGNGYKYSDISFRSLALPMDRDFASLNSWASDVEIPGMNHPLLAYSPSINSPPFFRKAMALREISVFTLIF
jgi:hypothetical protein